MDLAQQVRAHDRRTRRRGGTRSCDGDGDEERGEASRLIAVEAALFLLDELLEPLFCLFFRQLAGDDRVDASRLLAPSAGAQAIIALALSLLRASASLDPARHRSWNQRLARSYPFRSGWPHQLIAERGDGCLSRVLPTLEGWLVSRCHMRPTSVTSSDSCDDCMASRASAKCCGKGREGPVTGGRLGDSAATSA